MSVFVTMNACCPACNAAWEIEVVGSVNADRAPELRDCVLDGSFQAQVCDSCGMAFRLPPRFTYVDFGRHQWFVGHPTEESGRWPEHEAMAQEMFETSFADNAPPAVQDMAAGVRRRIVYGWPALREKLLCHDHGVDDLTMELFKTALLRYIPAAPVSDATELRFDCMEDGKLVLSWFMAGTEQRLSQVRVPRAAFDGFEREPEWDTVRAQFANAAFVDMERLMVRA